MVRVGGDLLVDDADAVAEDGDGLGGVGEAAVFVWEGGGGVVVGGGGGGGGGGGVLSGGEGGRGGAGDDEGCEEGEDSWDHCGGCGDKSGGFGEGRWRMLVMMLVCKC